MVWPEDVPPEVVSQQRAAAKKEAKPRKPALRAISGEAADRNGDEAEVPSTRRSDTPRPAEVRREVRTGNTPRPPRLVQVASTPSGADSASMNGTEADAQRPDAAPAADEARPPTTKRSRPPYLRLVD
jgi:hypothetical protein